MSRLPTAVEAAIDRLLPVADALAARFAGDARSMVSAGRERAVLRALGVTGIDREGRPLAAEVVDRFAAGRPDRLAAGIGRPFALALDEYDTNPQQLALDLVAGSIDLVAESALLARPAQRARADTRLAALVAAAADRIDANRVARAELQRVLGEPARPWIGVDLLESEVGAAITEAGLRASHGADVLRVEVPVGRELASDLGAAGRPVAGWQPPPGAPEGDGEDREPAPTGSQRGIGRLREALDRAAVERGAYLRLAVAPAALAGPEGALVAAIERGDLLDLDPMADIVGVGVDPERALADLAAAAAMCRRARLPVVVGAGPLVVGPELVAGSPADPATRSGRAFGLQLLGVRILVHLGLDPGLVVAGGLPGWVAGEPDGAARAAAELAVRARSLASVDLALLDPGGADTTRWAAVVAALTPADRTGLIRLRGGDGFATLSDGLRAAAGVTAELAGRADRGSLRGVAAEHAAGMTEAAGELLGWLSSDGWDRVLGTDRARPMPRLGSEAIARRAEGDATATLFG